MGPRRSHATSQPSSTTGGTWRLIEVSQPLKTKLGKWQSLLFHQNLQLEFDILLSPSIYMWSNSEFEQWPKSLHAPRTGHCKTYTCIILGHWSKQNTENALRLNFNTQLPK